MKVKATAVARGRWQLDGEVEEWRCGCRWLCPPNVTGLVERARLVATCKAHRRGVGLPLQPWVPS